MTDDIVQRLYDRAFSGKAKDPLCEEAAAEIARLRAATDHWHTRAEPAPLDKPVLFFTNHLGGFIWIGRRGPLPNDVSHWMHLPSPPGAADAKD